VTDWRRLAGLVKRPRAKDATRTPDARRDAVELALCRQAMQPGQFDELTPQSRQALVRRLREQLQPYSLDFLEEAAEPGPDRPTILLDEALNVSFAQKTQGVDVRGVDALALEAKTMAEANEQGLLFHGYDPDGTAIITSMDQLTTHMAVVGTSGTGKSTQLARYFVQLAQKGGPMILIDPHGTLIQDILPRLPAHRRKDVVYITPNDTKRNWGINLLQVGRKLRASKDEELDPETLENVLETTVQTIVQALAQIQEDESGLAAGVSIQATLQMFAQAAAEHPDATFVDVYQIATSRKMQDLVKGDIRNPIVRQYFEDTLPELRVEYLERVRNKLQKFVSSSAMVNMFSRRQEGKDLKTLIEEDRIVLFDLNRKLGMPYQVSNLIGFIVVTLVMLVVDHRQPAPGQKLKPFHMMIDEFQNVASKSTVRWFTEARKQNASLIVAFQHLHQLTEDVRNALGNASTWCAFRSTPQDARFLAPLLGLGNAGKTDVSELVEVPQFEMRLRYDEEDVQAENRPMKRSLVTVRAPPLPRAPENAAQIIAAIREYSSRRYTIPVNASDKETILGAADTSNIDVLQAIFEASFALRNPGVYQWGGNMHPKTRWAIDNGIVTSSLAHHVLTSKGVTMKWDRFGGLKEALIRRRLVTGRPAPSGYDQLSLTPRGLEELFRHIDPNKSQNEGGELHRLGLRRLFVALTSLAPMRIIVPDQAGSEYRPDLIGDVSAGSGFLNRVTDRQTIHFQVEEATRSKPEKVMANMVRAHSEQAFPVMVLNAPTDGPPEVAAASFFDRLHREATGQGVYPPPEDLKQAFDRSPHGLFAVWIVTDAPGLLEFDPMTRKLVPVGPDFRSIGIRSQPKPIAAAPPPQGPATPPTVAPPQAPASAPVASRPPGGPRDAKELFLRIINDQMLAGAADVGRDWVKQQMGLHEVGVGVTDSDLDAWASACYMLRIVANPMGPRYCFI
jgi:ABC-type oligopeptide transport system ATPase subunit